MECFVHQQRSYVPYLLCLHIRVPVDKFGIRKLHENVINSNSMKIKATPCNNSDLYSHKWTYILECRSNKWFILIFVRPAITSLSTLAVILGSYVRRLNNSLGSGPELLSVFSWTEDKAYQ